MEEMENAPDDIRKSTPVENEVSKLNDDLVVDKTYQRPRVSARGLPCQDKKKGKPPEDCCEERKKKLGKTPSKAIMWVHRKPCLLPKRQRIPRDCYTNKEYLDWLSTPKKKCPPDCEKIPINARVIPMSQRLKQIALPTKNRILATLEHNANVMPVECVDNMLRMLEIQTALTPEQAEDHLQSELCKQRKSKFRKQKGKSSSKCKVKTCKTGPKRCLNLDKEAVKRQYAMMEQCVRSILEWECCMPRSDYEDISVVVFKRLCYTLDYTPREDEDRKTQQIRFLADIVSCWIAGIICEASVGKQEQLEDERNRLAEEEESDDEVELDLPSDDEDDGMSGPSESAIQDDATEVEIQVISQDQETQTEDQGMTQEELDALERQRQAELDRLAELQRLYDELAAKQAEWEIERQNMLDALDRARAEAEKPMEDKQVECEGETCEEEVMTDEITVNLFKTELPWVTLHNMVQSLYRLLDCLKPNDECDPIVNRMQAAIYERFVRLVISETPDLLDENVKNTAMIVSGKIAVWFKCILGESQIMFMDKYPAVVEGPEILAWSKWLLKTTNRGKKWKDWLETTVREAKSMAGKPMTRGDYHDWTKKMDIKALQWRKYYNDTRHIARRNRILLSDRDVVGCDEQYPELDEFTEEELQSIINLEHF